MTATGDEEEGGVKGGRPNLYWQQVRERAAEESTGLRGTGQRKPPGAEAPPPIGDYDTCWCGEPQDHYWPGKEHGRRHPRKATTMSTAATDPERLTRRDLPGFDADLVEVITKAVNDHAVRYRLTRSGIILFPRDGSEPYTMHKNASPRSVKAAQVWFVRHVAEDEADVKPQKQKTEVTPEDLRRLAEEVSTVEHPLPEPKGTEPVRNNPPQSTEDEDAWKNPPGEWGTFRRKHNNSIIEGFERLGDTDQIRCTRCEWTGRGIATSGHTVKHDPSRRQKMYGEAAQQKKRETHATHKVQSAVEEAITVLSKAIGYQPEVNAREVERLRARITALETENGDLQAKLDLMREALRA